MLQLYPLVLLLVVVQVLGQDIENGVLECDGDWCLVKCNYGYVPTGNYFVPTDQTAGRLTLYTFTSQSMGCVFCECKLVFCEICHKQQPQHKSSQHFIGF